MNTNSIIENYNPDFVKEIRENFSEKLDNDSLALIYSGKEVMRDRENPYPFRVDSNYFYLTHLKEENGLLAIYKDKNGEVYEYLFIPEIDQDKARWLGESYSIERAREISLIENVYTLEKIPEILAGIESQKIYYPFEQLENQRFDISQIGKTYEDLIDLTPILNTQRLIKTEDEIALLLKAIDATAEDLDQTIHKIKPGKKEYVYSVGFEAWAKERGYELGFDSIVASGKNAVKLHYPQQDSLIGENDLILFDIGVNTDGYTADVSRTYPVSGEFDELQKAFYEVVLKTQKEMIKLYTPGTRLRDIQKATQESFIKNLKEAGITLPQEGINQWYYHSIGHSLGIDAHDSIDRDLVLEPGMIITCEPGLYAKEYGIGIRIEDDILVAEEPLVLTQNIPKEIKDVEALMKEKSIK